jgi:hypothetical protein
MALRCRFSFLSRFNVGGKLWWRCIGPYRPWLSVIRHFGDSFPAPHPSTHSFFHSVHVHALNPRREARRKYTVKKHSIITTEKKKRRDGKPAKYKLCDAFSCWIYPRTCAPVHLLSKDSPISDTGYMHFWNHLKSHRIFFIIIWVAAMDMHDACEPPNSAPSRSIESV